MDATKFMVGAIVVLSITVIIISMRACRTTVEADSAASGAVLMSYVRGIEGNSPDGRRQYIKTKLKEFDVPYSLMRFDTILAGRDRTRDTLRGENIIVTMG